MDNLSFEKIAVLIDADNNQSSKLKDILDEISKYGRIIVKKAYGDWKNPCLKNWEGELKNLAIKPVQQIAYTTGKNATDIALVIDAMDLLFSKIYDAFVIVSSDADYTPLAIRLRETGAYIMGIGDEKTPAAFRNSCDKFALTRNLVNGEEKTKTTDKKTQPSQKSHDSSDIHDLLMKASETYQDEDGWVAAVSAGNYIKRVRPDFEFKEYGFNKLTDFLRKFSDIYEIKTHKIDNDKITVYYYRIRSYFKS